MMKGKIILSPIEAAYVKQVVDTEYNACIN